MNDSQEKLPREIEDTFEGYFAARDFVNSAPKMSRDEFEDILMEKILAVHGGDILQLSTYDILTANTTFKFFLNRWLKNQIRGVEVDVLNTIEDQVEQTIDPDGLIVANRHVIELSVRGMGLISLPITFGGLSHLKKLDLANNKLTSLPDSFRLLTHLAELNIVNNSFGEFPDLLNDLLLLNTENRIKSSSSEVLISEYNLGNHLIYTQLNEIKGIQYNNKDIIFDRLKGNYPYISLSGLASYSKIEKIILANLKIQKLADIEALQQCNKLKHFGLPFNHLKSFRIDDLIYLPCLQEIDFQVNLLTKLDLSPLKEIPSLESIFFDCNRLTSLDLTPLFRHPNLTYVCIGANPINKLDISPLFTCRKMRTIDLISKIEFDIHHPLYDLMVSNNWVPDIQEIVFPSSISLNNFPDISHIEVLCSFNSSLKYDPDLFYISHEEEGFNVLKLLTD